MDTDPKKDITHSKKGKLRSIHTVTAISSYTSWKEQEWFYSRNKKHTVKSL